MTPADKNALDAQLVEVASSEERLRRRAERNANRLAWRAYAEELIQIESRTVQTLGAKFRRGRPLSAEETDRLRRAATRLSLAATSYIAHSEKHEFPTKKALDGAT